MMRLQMPLLGLLLGLLAAGCGEKEDDTSTTSAACEALDVDACAADSACTVISGRPLQTDTESGEACVDFGDAAVPLGCMRASDGCDAAETLGTAGGACTHWFSSGCLPEGWSTCESPEVVDSCPE